MRDALLEEAILAIHPLSLAGPAVAVLRKSRVLQHTERYSWEV